MTLGDMLHAEIAKKQAVIDGLKADLENYGPWLLSQELDAVKRGADRLAVGVNEYLAV